MKINVLGTEYDISCKSPDDDPGLDGCAGYCDPTSKVIVVTTKNSDFGNFEERQKKCLRHEIIHAFMYESGLCENWEHRDFGQEETVVDWFAIQSPKIMKVFEECGLL